LKKSTLFRPLAETMIMVTSHIGRLLPVSKLPVSSATRALILATRDSIAVLL
jgi:hypothetical protein